MAKVRKQIEKFREAARELDCDHDEDRFDEALKRMAKTPPPKDEKPAKSK